MSFYGDIKRVQSSPFVFDKIYPNRRTMEENAQTDNVYIGRYVLIKYTYYETETFTPVDLTADSYIPNYYYKNNGDSETDKVLAIENEMSSGVQYYIKTIVSDNNTDKSTDGAPFKTNLNIDVNGLNNDGYGASFDGTVWQKIYTNSEDKKQKYIMIAELNASAPEWELKIVNPKYYKEYNVEDWRVPEVNKKISTEDVFYLNMPNVLKLDIVNNNDFYAKRLIDAEIRREINSAGHYNDDSDFNAPGTTVLDTNALLSNEYNYLTWKNYFEDEPISEGTKDTEIDEKRLETKLYAFGSLLRDLYDIMYGRPANDVGRRPFFESDISKLISDKGLVGILSSIATDAKGDPTLDSWGRVYNPGLTYSFNTVWCGVDVDDEQYIENIPKVIGSTEELENGKAHFKIDFNEATVK